MYRRLKVFLSVVMISLSFMILFGFFWISSNLANGADSIVCAQGDSCGSQQATLKALNKRTNSLKEIIINQESTLAAGTPTATPTSTSSPTTTVTPSPTNDQPTNTQEVTLTPMSASIEVTDECENIEATIAALETQVSALQMTVSALDMTIQASLVQPSPTIAPPPTLTPQVLASVTPSLPPEVIPSPTFDTTGAIFVDQFDSNNNNWLLTDDIIIDGGILKVPATKELNLAIAPLSVTEFDLQVDIRGDLYLPDIPAGAVIAFGNLVEGQEFNFISFGREYIDVYQVTDGRWKFVTSMRTPPTGMNRIRVNYRDEQVAIYIDGELITTTFISQEGDLIGLGGVFGYDVYPAPSTVMFDNLVIRPPGGRAK